MGGVRYLHGRFTEMMAAHFHDYFSSPNSTAKPATGNRVLYHDVLAKVWFFTE